MRPTKLALVLSAHIAISFGPVKAQVGRPSRAPISPLPAPPKEDARKIALGRVLFHDPRLSRSMRLSCASCHDLSTNGASAKRVDRGDSGVVAKFNTPTVFNSAYSFRFGWQGRTRSLHELVLATLRAEHTMSAGRLSSSRLAADPAMRLRFQSIYRALPGGEDVADALTVFMRSLVTPGAPLDRWLRGDQAALTPQQVRGYRRFQLLGCASCHQGMNVGANIFQRRGVFHPLGREEPRYLRVPSLRNVAVTAPYFHDGRVTSLREAIRQMARSQLDLAISDADVRDIEAFLESLTGTYQGRSLRAPVASGR